MHLTRRATWYATGILGVLLGLLAYVAVGAVTSPSVRLVSIAVGFERPSVLALVDREMLVGEQAGTVRRLDGSTWMDLSASVRAEGEMGLLGLVEHPDDGRIFVTYTALNGDTVLSSFEGNDLDSELELLRVAQDSEVHKGGGMAFGPDGFLYVALGDDGWDYRQFRDTPVTELRGAVMRIDVSHAPYGIPPDNPFVGGGGRPELWDHGLRNPWRIAFDGADLWIADVGSLDWEEVNVHRGGGPGGLNFGWSVMEGTHCRNSDGCDSTPYTAPVVEYPHEDGDCALIGGYVYRAAPEAELFGQYIYGDYCSGRIRAVSAEGGDWRLLVDSDVAISTFGLDSAGRLYVAGIDDETIYRIDCDGCP